MTNNPLIPQSKLPQLGTTIFTQMSALAQQHQAINLSQGFPDFDGPRYLQERLAYHVAQGANQYAPMTGVQALREAIAQKTERLYGYQPDADSDITVTAGATEALYAAITALVRNGDEVICFDPSYDSYALYPSFCQEICPFFLSHFPAPFLAAQKKGDTILHLWHHQLTAAVFQSQNCISTITHAEDDPAGMADTVEYLLQLLP